MFSVSPAEILTIALVALVVFGPKRLPEITRKAGRALSELKSTAQELRDGIERELDESDLGQVRRELGSTLADLDPTSGGGAPPSAASEPPEAPKDPPATE